MVLRSSTSSRCAEPSNSSENSDQGNMRDSREEACSKEPACDRMRDFMSFLDQTASNSLEYEGRSMSDPSILHDAPSNNAMLLSKISALEVELEDKEHSLKALREVREREKLREENTRKQLLVHLRSEMAKHTVPAATGSLNSGVKLKQLVRNSAFVSHPQEKYEQELKRQQDLLSQVQDEKKNATHRCDRLADEIRELEKKFSAKAAELHKQYGRELERQRKAFLSGEKARREAWERDRAQEIKDITIKGLEPEIQRLLEKHRGERRSLEEKLKKMSIDMKSQLEQEVAAQKATLTRQMQESLEVERCQHRQEIRDLQDKFDSQLRKERESLIAKHQEELNKWESEVNHGKKSVEGAVMRAREEERLRCKEVASKLSEEIERMRQNHLAEIRQAAQAMKEKEEELLKTMEAAKATAVQEAVAAARKEVEAECHRKLDHLIERLSREQLEVQARFEQQCNEAVAASQASADQMRQQFVEERQKLEADLKSAHEKQLALERQISRLETEAELKEQMRAELQTALDEVSGRAQAAISETDSKTQALKSEWERDKQRCEEQQHQLESQKEMLDSLTAQLSEAKLEIEGMRKEEAERLEKLETKVKGTLFAKDQIIQRLKDELSASNTKADHLRGLMNKHRTELMQSAASSCDSFPIDSLSSTAASLLSPTDKSASVKSNALEQQQGEQPTRSKYPRLQTASRAQLELKTIRKKLQR